MASSVQFENTYAEDERWLEAGASAFALHFAACCYADRRNTDGTIPKVMVARVALAVAPEDVQTSIESLIETGFWTEEKTAYRIVNYLDDKIGIAAEEKLANRARWAEDKRWRRKHNAGNHTECPPEKCRQSVKTSQTDIGGTPRKSSAGVQEDSPRTTRLDTTRLDSTPGGGSESEGGGRPSGPASAGATASPRSAKKPRSRTMANGFVVTPVMVGGADPNTLDQDQLENMVSEYLEGVGGLLSVGGAGG